MVVTNDRLRHKEIQLSLLISFWFVNNIHVAWPEASAIDDSFKDIIIVPQFRMERSQYSRPTQLRLQNQIIINQNARQCNSPSQG